MKHYYVEVCRPAYPARGISYRVFTDKEYSTDVLSPCTSAVFRVGCCRSKQEAVALVLEYAAGVKGIDVQCVIGKRAL